MIAEQALHNFWSGFGLTAYDENSVPDEAVLPYITYSVSIDSFGNEVSLTASLWYESLSWVDITNVTHEISKAIGYSGKTLKTDSGYLWLKRGQPFAQRMGDDDKNIKRMYINITAEYFSEN